MASAHFRMGSLGLWDRVGLTQGRCPSSGLRHGSRTAGGMGPWVAPRTPGSRRSLGLLCAVWRDSHAGPSAASWAPAVGCPVVAGQWRRCSRDQAAPPGEVVPVVRLRGEGLGAENQETRQIEGAPDGPDARESGRRPDTQPRRRSASAPTPPAPVPPLQEEALASQETLRVRPRMSLEHVSVAAVTEPRASYLPSRWFSGDRASPSASLTVASGCPARGLARRTREPWVWNQGMTGRKTQDPGD